MKRTLFTVAGLTLLLTAIDRLYRVLYPEVDFLRASLVGATAWLALILLPRFGQALVPARIGALAIFASAAGSVALIQAGVLVSRSPTSALVHGAILAVAYLVLERRYGAASSWTASERAEGSCGSA
jgi:hypothetical protein